MLPAGLAGRTLARGAPPKAAGVRLEEARQAHWLVVWNGPAPQRGGDGRERPGWEGPQPARWGWGMGLDPSTRLRSR